MGTPAVSGLCIAPGTTTVATETRGPHSRAFIHVDEAGNRRNVCHLVQCLDNGTKL
jgi:hypothetical protein